MEVRQGKTHPKSKGPGEEGKGGLERKESRA